MTLTSLVNLSLETDEFPSVIKKGKVVPILKKTDSSLLNNDPPVTVPYSFSKVFEYTILCRLNSK